MSRSSFALAFCLGVSAAILSGISPPLLLFAAVLFCLTLGRECGLIPPYRSWAWPFLALLIASFAAQLTLPGQGEAFMFYFRENDLLSGLSHLWSWFAQSPPDYFLSLQNLLRWLVLIWIFELFRSAPQLFAPFRKGLLIGVAAALVVAALQVCGIELPFALHSQTPYWEALQRIGATYTDPNAFGLVMFFCLPFLHEEWEKGGRFERVLYGSLAVCAVSLALFSGSRSFVLGLLLYAAIIMLRRSPRIFALGCAVAAGFLLLVNLWSHSNSESFLDFARVLPVSLERALHSVVLSSSPLALFSRLAFNRIGSAIWLDNWLSGVGLSHFARLVPVYSAELGLPTGLWSDNANNFYLGVLAELGLVGLAALFLGLSKLRSAASASSCSLAALQVFLLLLFFGPHLDFTEVTILAAVHMARSIGVVEKSKYGAVFNICLAAAAGLIIIQARYAEFGWHGWEGAAQGGFGRWSMARAQSVLDCDQDGNAPLQFSVLHPGLAEAPLKVEISAAFNEKRVLLVDKPGTLNLEFSCTAPSVYPDNELRLANLPFHLSVSRLWSPALRGSSPDGRPLGVYQHLPRLKKPIYSDSWFSLG